MSGLSRLKIQRNEIVKQWEKSGLLDGLTQASNKSNLVQLFETMQGYTYAHKLDDSSLNDTISYFENRVAGARRPEQKIRPMNQLILVMTCNIIKKHCS